MTKKISIEERLDNLLNKVDNLENRVVELEAENKQLKEENCKFKKRLSKYETPKNSKNSSKPPSSDFPKPAKTSSLRKKSGKKPGGQKGHIGNTLKIVSNPDIITNHQASYCTCCGNDLSIIVGEYAGKRQVIDIPPIQPVITEHRIFHKQCRCGTLNKGNYPSEVNAPVSYGAGVQALIGYMSARQYMPYERLKEFLHTVLGINISSGGINQLIGKITAKAKPYYEQIRKKILSGKIIGADETGTNVNGKLHWAWVFQNPDATFLSIHTKRGFAAMEEIMPEGFKNNTLVTDCWKSYFMTDANNHQLCTAHLLRELEYFCQKYPKNNWAFQMRTLIKNALSINKGQCTDKKPSDISDRFQALLKQELDEEVKEVQTFQNRLKKYEQYLFNFLINPDIPPDNNASERAVRNFKVKQKVSGFFKSIEGADCYAILRSIVDSAIKNIQNPLCTLRAIATSFPISE